MAPDQGLQLVAKLQADAHTYEELARVNRTKAEAVATLVRGELATEGAGPSGKALP